MLGELLLAIGLANYILGAVAAAALTYAVARRLLDGIRTSDERSFLLGVGKAALGLVLHQAWWLTSRVAYNTGHREMTAWFTENSWALTFAYILMVAGALRCVAVVAGTTTLRFWRLAGIVLWLIGIAIGLMIS